MRLPINPRQVPPRATPPRHPTPVERTFAWLHAFKRLAIRYERRGDLHHGLVGLACCLICWRRLQTDY